MKIFIKIHTISADPGEAAGSRAAVKQWRLKRAHKTDIINHPPFPAAQALHSRRSAAKCGQRRLLGDFNEKEAL